MEPRLLVNFIRGGTHLLVSLIEERDPPGVVPEAGRRGVRWPSLVNLSRDGNQFTSKLIRDGNPFTSNRNKAFERNGFPEETRQASSPRHEEEASVGPRNANARIDPRHVPAYRGTSVLITGVPRS